MKSKWAARFLLFLLLTLGAATVQAQSTPPPLIDKALADLGQKLGTSIQLSDLTTWNFQQNLYNDTALGCALVKGNPTTQAVSAYRFTMEYKGKTYDYRVSADGNTVIACDANLLGVTPGPTGTPVVGCPADFAGYLPPRLQVNTQAQVIASNNAPNRLRSAPSTDAEQIALIPPGRTFDVIGGPSCGQNYVWWQVSYNGQTGWTVEGQLPNTYFLESVNANGTATATITGTAATATATIAATLPAATPAQPSAPAAVNAALAGVTNKLLTLYNLDDSGVPTAYATVGDVSGPNGLVLDQAAWSPDGQHLAYTVFDQNYVSHLYLTDRAGSTPVQLATDLYTLLPPTFTPDSAQVIYGKKNAAAPTQTANGPGMDSVQIFSQPITGSGTAAVIATINFGVGCGGGSPYPGDWQYSSEAGYGGHHLTLAMTPFGILYSNSCNGIGTALLKLDSGQSVDVGNSLSRASLSPDGTKVVGIAANIQTPLNGVLTVVDLQTLQTTPLGAASSPDQVTWGPDGSIYYTTIANGDRIPGSDTAAAGLGSQGITRRNVSIHRVDLGATTDAQIYAASAYAIGRLFVTPDNQALYFSSIPNGDRYVDALNKGVLTQQSPQSDLLAYFAVELYRIALPSDAAQTVSADLAKATLNRAAFGAGTTSVPVATVSAPANGGVEPTAQG